MESGLVRSRNGGLDWRAENPAVVIGPVFAATFAPDGSGALVSSGRGILRCAPDGTWRRVAAPDGVSPARAIVRGSRGQIYVVGSGGLFRSGDWGGSWTRMAGGLPSEPATALVVAAGAPEILYAVARGTIWASSDDGRTWLNRAVGLPPVDMEIVAWEPTHGTIWAAGHGRLFKSSDGGARWVSQGRPLAEPNTSIRGLAASDTALVVATNRGVYRSLDDGETWRLAEDLAPHLEAGPLVRDPTDPRTIYAGFALIPYPELWERAAGRSGIAQRPDARVGGGVIMIIAVVGSAMVVALRWLERREPRGADRQRGDSRTRTGRMEETPR
jgi:photosystem II stability/assembly factor-like uncharacterized protein